MLFAVLVPEMCFLPRRELVPHKDLFVHDRYYKKKSDTAKPPVQVLCRSEYTKIVPLESSSSKAILQYFNPAQAMDSVKLHFLW